MGVAKKIFEALKESSISDSEFSEKGKELALQNIATMKDLCKNKVIKAGGADRPGEYEYYGYGEDMARKLLQDDPFEYETQDIDRILNSFNFKGYWCLLHDWNNTTDNYAVILNSDDDWLKMCRIEFYNLLAKYAKEPLTFVGIASWNEEFPDDAVANYELPDEAWHEMSWSGRAIDRPIAGIL